MIEAAIIRVVDENPLITMNEHKRVMELTIKQAKREVLMEAAEKCAEIDGGENMFSRAMYQMAGEIE
jgi:hypothetical protein